MQAMPLWMTPVQGYLWSLRLQNRTIRDIRATLNALPNVHICNDEVITRAIKATALGYPWTPQSTGGSWPYLCPEDELALVQTIKDSNSNQDSLPIWVIINSAHDLKLQRVQEARAMLMRMNHPQLAISIEDPAEPDRTWVNQLAQLHGLKIKNAEYIEAVRRQCCDHVAIRTWFGQFGAKIAQYHPDHIFNMDETGLSTNRKYKVVVPAERHALTPGGDKNIHITGIVTFNRRGEHPKPGIILPALKNLPPELADFQSNADFYSAPTGWITNEVFAKWAVNFAHWTRLWRRQLPANRQQRRILLIMDGHTTRRHVGAMLYLWRNGIDVLTLPGHCSHILQPFDVGIASPLKAAMRREIMKYEALIRAGGLQGMSAVGMKRLSLVSSFLEALCRSLTPANSSNAFARCGITPVNPMIPLNSPFLPLHPRFRPAVEQIQSSMLIESLEDIFWLADVTEVPTWRGIYYIPGYQELITASNSGRLLTPIQPF